MPRVFSLFLFMTFLLGTTAGMNPCSAGSLVVYTENEKCECRRHNGAMGHFRPQCSASLTDGECTGTCNAPEPKEQLALEADADKCFPGTRACPVGLSGSEYECVSPDEDVDNCGGCASTGEGIACGDYVGVRGAACVEGACEVYSCFHGYTLDQGACVKIGTSSRVKGKGSSKTAPRS
ncbi:hypothetical protein C8R45DRAFT_304383 [Mycena sanguinolenta]|nr:hypothetical protein C8R45DRAFT_304383 [Mycena sanguinolenta]